MRLELAQHLEEVAVVVEQAVFGELLKRLFLHLDNLQIEEEELPSHGVAELLGLLGEPFVQIALAVGGEQQVRVELRHRQILLQLLVTFKRLQQPLGGEFGYLAAVALPERCNLRSSTLESLVELGC